MWGSCPGSRGVLGEEGDINRLREDEEGGEGKKGYIYFIYIYPNAHIHLVQTISGNLNLMFLCGVIVNMSVPSKMRVPDCAGRTGDVEGLRGWSLQ